VSDRPIDIYPFLAIKNGDDILSRIAVRTSWVPQEFHRRQKAYTVLAAYAANMANVVRKSPEVEDGKLREYGDANFVCTAMSCAVIGDDVRIVSPESKEQEAFFTQWAEKEMFFAKLAANEYKASNLGDCVYKLAWSKDKSRVRIYTIDPGFWFPFDIGLPTERHIFAWEEDDGKGGKRIHKEEYWREFGGGSEVGGGAGSSSIRFSVGKFKLSTQASFQDLQLISWATDEEGRVLDNVDLAIDTFPIVYIPNIYREGCDFGESDLTGVYRILDDLSNVYTDQQQNAYIMGLVLTWVEKEAYDLLPIDSVTGKKVLRTDEVNILPGQAGVVDNSSINKALFDTQHELESKLFKNTFLGLLGSGTEQSASGDRTTGIFQLKGSILERFVAVKRLTRTAKYNMLLRIIGKFEKVLGKNALFNGDVKATIQFGNILPINQKALMENVNLIQGRLSNEDLRDNVREAGITVNRDMTDVPKPQPITNQPTGATQ
jgi:hypothetical protein